MKYSIKDFDKVRQETLIGISDNTKYGNSLSASILNKLCNIQSYYENSSWGDTKENSIDIFPHKNLTTYSEDSLEWLHEVFENVSCDMEDFSKYLTNDLQAPISITNISKRYFLFWFNILDRNDGEITILPETKEIFIGIFDLTDMLEYSPRRK